VPTGEIGRTATEREPFDGPERAVGKGEDPFPYERQFPRSNGRARERVSGAHTRGMCCVPGAPGSDTGGYADVPDRRRSKGQGRLGSPRFWRTGLPWTLRVASEKKMVSGTGDAVTHSDFGWEEERTSTPFRALVDPTIPPVTGTTLSEGTIRRWRDARLRSSGG
jgi:hypothetical protein